MNPPLQLPRQDAAAFLAEEHERLRGLLHEALHACRAGRDPRSAGLATLALHMQVHDTLEDEVLYPEASLADVAPETLARAALDHAILRALVTDLQSIVATMDERTRTLHEILERFDRHAREEEEVLLPALAESGVDLDALGRDLVSRRDELLRALARMRGETARGAVDMRTALLATVGAPG